MKIKIMKAKAAPCCYIIARQRPDGTFDARDEMNTVLIQTDWDYPSVARTFGGRLSQGAGVICDHGGTDGTIDCPECGLTASAFIGFAQDYLNAHIGAIADDPGYFDGM